MGKWVGTRVERFEDEALFAGTATFMHDLAPAGRTGHMALLRSPFPHARLVDIDTSLATRLAGVHAVLTGADVAARSRPIANILTADAPMFPLAVDRARYVGEPVALVVASSRAVAEDACELIRVQYQPLDCVVDPVAALDAYAPVLHDALGTNLVHERTFEYGSPDRVFAEAEHVISIETHYPRSTATPLETFGIVAEHHGSDDSYTIWSNYGGPLALQTVMAASLGVPVGRLRLVMPANIGGNFGIKSAMYPLMIVTALAARAARRPVTWVEDRNEHMASASAGSERLTGIDGAFDADGRLMAMRVRQLENFGAYVRTPEPAGLYRMHGTLTGPYDCRHLAVENRGVLTNQVPSGLNRGFGGPQLVFALEGLLDEAAGRLGLSRVEIRRRNLVRADAFPYSCPAGSILDSGNYVAVLDRALELAGAYGDATVGALRGVGIGCSVETSGNNLGYMSLAADPDDAARQLAKSGAGATVTLTMDAFGAVTVQLDSPACGQGYRTAAAQVVADELGLRPTDITVRTELDTASDGWILTSGNYANRFSTAVAAAATMAARRTADKLRRVAALGFDSHPTEITLVDGQAVDARTGGSVAIRRLAGQLHWHLSERPDGVDGPIRETAVFAPSELGAPTDGRIQTSFTYSFQCDVATVEIDPHTGVVTVLDYVSVHDAGTVLNPGLFEGQVRGGFAHGFGAAMHEAYVYDPDGTLATADFVDYAPVRAADLVNVRIDHLETPSPHTLTGAKGLGDGCAMLSPAVLASAIADALGVARAELIPPPYTPARVWALLARIGRDA